MFLRGNRALAENVAPRPFEITTFYTVSGLPPHVPPLFVEFNFYGKCMYFLKNVKLQNDREIHDVFMNSCVSVVQIELLQPGPPNSMYYCTILHVPGSPFL